MLASAAVAQESALTSNQMKEETVLFTAPGFQKTGEAKWIEAAQPDSGQVEIIVRDASTGELTPARINVVGPDGNFYQPAANRLSRYALTGVYPATGLGNRLGKGPYRYVGRFFYAAGQSTVRVPVGFVRVEVWKGLEFAPQTKIVSVAAGENQRVEVALVRSTEAAAMSYFSGDTHLHFARETKEDDETIFDLLGAEGLNYGFILAPNRPPGQYTGTMDKMAVPQKQGLGRRSIRSRAGYHIMSGQEYRSNFYGHLKLLLLDDLVFAGKTLDADKWPVYGEIGRSTLEQGGFAIQAHGGYGKEVYADVALGTISAIELLQFGIYREIELQGWYNMLNTGYRIAAEASSDYPACRTLADGRTYVYHPTPPSAPEWLAGQAAGRSFFTTGPLLLLEVDGEKPGAQFRKQGAGPQTAKARIRVRCEVTPVTDVDLIVNGRVVKHLTVPRSEGQGRWVELEHTIALEESAWIAARAYSTSPGGMPDAEAHTNPVYVYLKDRAPFKKAAVDAWIAKIDAQIAVHAERQFPENSRVWTYFQQARDVLLRIRAQGGMAASADPAPIVAQLNVNSAGLRNLAADGSVTDATDDEMRAFLGERVRPTKPTEALAAFETVGGFRMELVAAEPLVRSPIAAAFDEDGNLFVGEMLDYPFNPRARTRISWQRQYPPGAEPSGTVRLLRDTNGDGVFDESHVFADKLLWVGGIVPWKGGVYVTAPPDIWYLKDTNGDGKADIRQKIYTGFGVDRQQGFVNSLHFGLDHKIYAATNGNGGDVRPANEPTAKPISVHGYDFRFTPATHQLELQTGTRVFGMSFDDWGNRFLCDQTNPAVHAVLPTQYLQRNPHFVPRLTTFITSPAPTSVFRISPIERWRHIKSSRRFAGTDRPADIVPLVGSAALPADKAQPATIPGVSHHLIDATAGVTIYRGGAYPAEYYGNAFVGDGQVNIVHRRLVGPEGVTFKTVRADENTEFIRSSDNWFKPVNFVNAPDGTLYCLDMGREYSESANIPPDVEKHMDLSSGKERGRIYRIAPPGFRFPSPPRLSRAGTADLIKALESPHGWWRDTAHRLIFERQDKSAVPALERLVTQSKSPQARVHALWSLHGLNSLNAPAILTGLSDTHAGVRENAVQLAEEQLDSSSEIRSKIEALVSDHEPRVRMQVAFTIGQSRRWNQAELLARMARKNLGDAWIPLAIISSAAGCGGELFAAIAGDAKLVANPKGLDFLRQLAGTVGSQNRPSEVGRALESLAAIENRATAYSLLSALGDGLKSAGTTLVAGNQGDRVKEMLQAAPILATDPAQPDPVRRAAIEVLAFVPFSEVAPTLLALLAAKQPPANQIAAIRLLERSDEGWVGATLIKHFDGLAPAARTRAIDVLLERPDRIERLLKEVESNRVPRNQFSAKQVMTLRQHGDSRIRERVNAVFGVAKAKTRDDIIRTYQPALKLSGVALRGQRIFESRCSVCHQVDGLGFEFGPNLARMGSGGRAELLTSILDPNREVDAKYFLQQIETINGKSTAGILKNETPTAVTLVQVGGIERTVARASILNINTQRQSLMPEGLERGLNHQDMADLIEFLSAPNRKQAAR